MVSIEQKLLRGGAVAARRAHNPKVVGSSPTPATNVNLSKDPGMNRGLSRCQTCTHGSALMDGPLGPS